MTIFRLTEEIIFPNVELSESDGLLAIGGDLKPERILKAYCLGIFPWYNDDSPILWWSPDPRLVLLPDQLYISRSLRQLIKKDKFKITIDTAFEQVINNCSKASGRDSDGTWITSEMAQAYIELFRLGHAHSVESWYEGRLVGGLYGISMGAVFFGESMFFYESGASKAAFVYLVQKLQRCGFKLIDCQVKTDYLIGFGAKEIPRSDFIVLLKSALKYEQLFGKDVLV
ncbi:MAG: leucyl/phenylalanyl-tRNA--protein transferase [Nitrospirae bacterium]|nr:leucyl/phenylalanyl-tRNA--protein transferase [Nitrospirota bacterium]